MWRASRWLSRMIGDLLDLAQMEHGDLTLEIAHTDVAQAIVDAAVRRGARATRDPYADRTRPAARRWRTRRGSRQMLGNLLSNASKFSSPGSIIDIECRRDGDRVADLRRRSREGHPATDALGRIFDVFVQVDPGTTREAGGMGTGLYLTKQLCARMDADVSVESTPGVGSRFTIRLRVADAIQAPR